MIFLVGHHAVGKTEAAGVFAETGYMVLDTGPIIREVHSREANGLLFCDWVSKGEATHGHDFTNRVLVNEMCGPLAAADTADREVAMVGFRSLRGIRYLVKNLTVPLSRSVIVYFDTPPMAVLRERWVAREGQPISMAAFRRLLARDRDMGVEEIRREADHIVRNTGALDDFVRDIRILRDQLTAHRGADLFDIELRGRALT